MSRTKLRFPSIYNPAKQTEEEIISNFVVRLDEFSQLFQTIKNDPMKNPPQHFIVQGQRGYGKTTLLLRLDIEIRKNSELNQWLIPIMFDEEQYSVHTLAKLWEEVIDILEDKFEDFSGLSDSIDPLYETTSPEEEIFNQLVRKLREKNKKLVLLLDNFGDMTDKFTKKEIQRLREVLSTCSEIRLIGASSTILEFYHQYKHPFYEFFKVITLDELTRDETLLFLKSMGEKYQADEINKIIDEQPERIEALRRLTGSIPRTIVLLFQIFVDDVDGNSFKDLETILDSVTPLYKHRMDSLSTQQQVIIDAIAQSWDAISTKDISKKVRMASKAVSSQLNQLEKAQLIKKISTSTKNHLYQINERFFNIYYLMRLGKRKNRNKIIWLIKFFEVWCRKAELIERTQKHLRAIQKNSIYESHAYYITQALAHTSIPLELQHELLTKTKKHLKTKKSSLASLVDKSHLEIVDDVKKDILNGYYELAEKKLRKENADEKRIYSFIATTLQVANKELNTAEKYYLHAIQLNSVEAMFGLAMLYENKYEDIEKAEKYFLMAIENGHIEALFNLGLFYDSHRNDIEMAKKYYKLASDKNNPEAMIGLALILLLQNENNEEVLNLLKRAHELDNDIAVKGVYAVVLLSHDKIEDAIKIFKEIFTQESYSENIDKIIIEAFRVFLLKQQTNFLYNLFTENKFDIKEKFKPIYYATVKLMGKDYEDEFKKMPPELAETVGEILHSIKIFGQETNT